MTNRSPENELRFVIFHWSFFFLCPLSVSGGEIRLGCGWVDRDGAVRHDCRRTRLTISSMTWNNSLFVRVRVSSDGDSRASAGIGQPEVRSVLVSDVPPVYSLRPCVA